MLTDRGLQRGELLLEHLDDKWRQAFRRLVEEQDLGVHHHRAGDGEHLLLAAAQRARPLVSPVREISPTRSETSSKSSKSGRTKTSTGSSRSIWMRDERRTPAQTSSIDRVASAFEELVRIQRHDR